MAGAAPWETLVRLRLPRIELLSVAITARGPVAVTAAGEVGQGRVYRLLAGTSQVLLNCRKALDRVQRAAISSDGTRVITTGKKRGIADVWCATTGAYLLELRGHRRDDDTIYKLGFSFDGTRIFTGSEDGTTRVWDADAGEALAVLPPFAAIPTELGAPSDMEEVWRAIEVEHEREADGENVTATKQTGLRPKAIALSPDSTRLAVWGGPRNAGPLSLDIWRLDSGRRSQLRHSKDYLDQSSLVWSPNGALLASSLYSGKETEVELWNVELEQPALLRRWQLGVEVKSLVFSPDASLLAANVNGAGVCVWHTDNPDSRAQVCLEDGRAIAFTADGRALWAVKAKDHELQLVALPQGFGSDSLMSNTVE